MGKSMGRASSSGVAAAEGPGRRPRRGVRGLPRRLPRRARGPAGLLLRRPGRLGPLSSRRGCRGAAAPEEAGKEGSHNKGIRVQEVAA